MTNYVDLVSSRYPSQHRCSHCRVVVRFTPATWRDGAGSEQCPDGRTTHVGAPVVAPSPLIDPAVVALRGGL